MTFFIPLVAWCPISCSVSYGNIPADGEDLLRHAHMYASQWLKPGYRVPHALESIRQAIIGHAWMQLREIALGTRIVWSAHGYHAIWLSILTRHINIIWGRALCEFAARLVGLSLWKYVHMPPRWAASLDDERERKSCVHGLRQGLKDPVPASFG